MKREKGNWAVVRNCCLSGNCACCHGITPYGKPLRIVQADGYSKKYAEYVAKNWALYGAETLYAPLGGWRLLP